MSALNRMNKAELEEECRKNDLDTDGTKEVLKQRLLDFFACESNSASRTGNSEVDDEIQRRNIEMEAELAAL